ncbi:hypothetical protein [Tenacibaculum piscium]|uniref:hypothetical protein n=1 Tax=Tenacibaculum piscium TaxID=1458515 RepID=UPI00187BA580|nr:hypothetical protein [Tenacibaculum piscium]MBE7691160.1 hypothetical protein [Tenacibaculum piscium]
MSILNNLNSVEKSNLFNSNFNSLSKKQTVALIESLDSNFIYEHYRICGFNWDCKYSFEAIINLFFSIKSSNKFHLEQHFFRQRDKFNGIINNEDLYDTLHYACELNIISPVECNSLTSAVKNQSLTDLSWLSFN